MIECRNLVKIYRTKDTETVALQGFNLTVHDGEMLAVMGASGSGKSTLLNIIGCLEEPSAGKLIINGTDIYRLSESERTEWRKHHIGFLKQNSADNLLPYLTVLENVLVPMRLSGKPDKKKAESLLEAIGMVRFRDRPLAGLSGGEQQRVAIAVALAGEAEILLADEPTGNVDRQTCDDVMRLLTTVCSGKTVLIVTHDTHLSSMVERVIEIRDGRLSGEKHVEREYAVLSPEGLLQIPKELLVQAGITSDKITVSVRGQEIILTQQE